MKASTIYRLLWWLAGLALLLGVIRDPVLKRLALGQPLAPAHPAAGGSWLEGGFRLNGAYPTTLAGLLPANIPHAGSWLDGDEWQGRAETGWFNVSTNRIVVGVAGYPRKPGCALWTEFRLRDGRTTRSDCPLINPREQWNRWELVPPAGAVALRIVGEDHSSGHAGWLAFSHPFTALPVALSAGFELAQVFTTLALALVLLWGPGLVLHARGATAGIRGVILLGMGPLILAALGVTIWLLSGRVKPQTLGFTLVNAEWLALAVAARRRRFDFGLSALSQRTLAVSVLVVVAVVAKSMYSVGPQGELFQGTVSRNMEMADRIDSRYSFYVVQVATHHFGPSDPRTEKFFHPWTFFSRGPLAGLATVPVVMATQGRPTDALPEERWSPFDPTGFAAYRLTMIALASTVIVALFLLLAALASEHWAFAGAGLLALSPFGVHDLMFTWPKWAATAWLLLSFGFAHERRAGAAGLTLAAGFLFHPLALLWAPWIGLWAAGRSEAGWRARLGSLVRFGVAAGAIVFPWMILGAVMPHLPTTPLAGQGGFLRYFARADWKMPTWETWWHTRWMNFANTFIPLHLYLSEASFNHPKLSSAYEASGRLIKFSQLWWNSLPFGLGLGLWGVSVATFGRAMRALPAAVLLFVIGPALLLVAYWGMDPLGLLRECGHPLFATVIALGCVLASQPGGWLGRVLGHRIVPWLQLPETWLMLWLTTFANSTPWAAEFDQLDAVYFALNALALVAAAWVVSRERMREPLAGTRVPAVARTAATH